MAEVPLSVASALFTLLGMSREITKMLRVTFSYKKPALVALVGLSLELLRI
jgi:hypothetical protein